MCDSGDFFVHFSVLPDPRIERTKKHLLVDILFIAVCTILCGGEGFTDMEIFGESSRIETRRYWIVEDDATQWLERENQWPGLKSIAAVQSERKIRGKTTTETRYFISSLKGKAEKLANATREHWAIENSLHYVLDGTFNEDKSRIRKDNAPENLVVLRRIALNMVKKEKTRKGSVRGKVKTAGWDNSYLEQILVS